jgi:hypothetical protein
MLADALGLEGLATIKLNPAYKVRKKSKLKLAQLIKA